MRRANPNPSMFYAAALAAFLLASAGSLPAQTCSDAVPFRQEVLVDRARHQFGEPIKMAFDMDGEGKVDIYFASRGGKVHRYDARTEQVHDLGEVPVNMILEGGITGLALDPDFKRNRRIYVGHTASAPGMAFRVTRYTLDAAGRLDPRSVKTLLNIPAADKMHDIMSLKFDHEGNLFVGTGNNFAGEESASNTMDLRGKILRIRPDDTGGYGIPAGNLFPPGKDSARPEIYVMGVRQPYVLAYDPATRRLAWGEFGPDGTGARTEEHNVTDKPGNFGWPHFAGRQYQMFQQDPRDPQVPRNKSLTAKGLKVLPPMVPAVHVYGQSGSVSGPLYRLPPDAHPNRLPPRFDGLWFITDFNQGWVDTIRLDAAGTGIAAQGRLRELKLNRPIDFQEGPDGGLYVINYAGNYSPHADANIVRLVYQGCPTSISGAPGENPVGTTWSAAGGYLRVTGSHRIRMLDPQGRLIREFRGNGGATYELRAPAGGPSVAFLEGAPTGILKVTLH